jgi:hypothetical protein
MIEIPDDLALADRYVAQTKRRLDEQASRIRRLATAGRDIAQAEETFRGMQRTLSGLRARREQLLFELLGQ